MVCLLYFHNRVIFFVPKVFLVWQVGNVLLVQVHVRVHDHCIKTLSTKAAMSL